MKYLASICMLFVSCSFLMAQGGVITGFSILPTNPTSNDTVYIHANLQFSSGSCDLDNMSHSVSGFNIPASTHHCVGMAAVICNVTDTFKINPLPAGNYNFNLSLTSGAAPAPCTAGIVTDDDSTFSFTVEPAGPAGTEDHTNTPFRIYPNPIHHQINLPSISDGTEFSLISMSGQMVKSGTVKGNVIDGLESLPAGLYLLKLNIETGEVVQQVAKI